MKIISGLKLSSAGSHRDSMASFAAAPPLPSAKGTLIILGAGFELPL